MKFLCREAWGFFFGKQADRLQVNKDTGGFVVWDYRFRSFVNADGSVGFSNFGAVEPGMGSNEEKLLEF